MKITKQNITDRFQDESAGLSGDDKKNLLRELLQETILCHMKEVGIFEDMAFHGGTSLRLLHRINRFSEDLDMSLIDFNPSYDFSKGMKRVEASLKSSGINLEFQNKCKEKNAIKKYWINDSELLNEFSNSIGNIVPGEKIKIKLELDVEPPAHQEFVEAKIQSPFSAKIYAHNLETCMGQKIHAILCRGSAHGMDIIKGRDLYDYEWYLNKQIRPNYKNLTACLNRIGPWKDQNIIATKDWVSEKIKESFKTKDFKLILQDVKPLIDISEFLKIETKWNADYFLNKM